MKKTSALKADFCFQSRCLFHSCNDNTSSQTILAQKLFHTAPKQIPVPCTWKLAQPSQKQWCAHFWVPYYLSGNSTPSVLLQLFLFGLAIFFWCKSSLNCTNNRATCTLPTVGFSTSLLGKSPSLNYSHNKQVFLTTFSLKNVQQKLNQPLKINDDLKREAME